MPKVIKSIYILFAKNPIQHLGNSRHRIIKWQDCVAKFTLCFILVNKLVNKRRGKMAGASFGKHIQLIWSKGIMR